MPESSAKTTAEVPASDSSTTATIRPNLEELQRRLRQAHTRETNRKRNLHERLIEDIQGIFDCAQGASRDYRVVAEELQDFLHSSRISPMVIGACTDIIERHWPQPPHNTTEAIEMLTNPSTHTSRPLSELEIELLETLHQTSPDDLFT